MTAYKGVKFKFAIGEKVLCYERDPTKTKLLYDSKILELFVNKDGRGKKIPEYLIHFYGWKPSHDRYVTEDYILPYTSENLELQRQLKLEVAKTLYVGKNRRKRKPPPILKDIIEKPQPNTTADSKKESSSESESSDNEENGAEDIKLDIPEKLKKRLEEDQVFIKNKSMLVQLPCDIPVVQLLEQFAAQVSVRLQGATGLGSRVPEGLPKAPADVLRLCRETLDSLRVLFDHILGRLLLYRQETAQFTAFQSRPLTDLRSRRSQPRTRAAKLPKSNSSRRKEEEEPPAKKPCNGITTTTTLELTPVLSDGEPALPSQVYGGHHLLRLFVVLGSILQKQRINRTKLKIILYFLENFLSFLEEGHKKFMPSAAYALAPDEFVCT